MPTPAKPLPSLETLNSLLVLDESTGFLFWKRGPFRGRRADHIYSSGRFRVRLWLNGGQVFFAAHRIIWKMVNGRDPIPEVDHIDRNHGNNRPENLREATRRENCRNMGRKITRRNGGVYPSKSGRYRAQISIHNKSVFLGTFPTEAEARAAVLAALPA
jgi:hypothetical protein